nr:protein AATF-like isoform X1 [Ipomoea batatas]
MQQNMRQLGNKAHKELSYAVVDLNWDDGTWEQSGNAFTLCFHLTPSLCPKSSSSTRTGNNAALHSALTQRCTGNDTLDSRKQQAIERMLKVRVLKVLVNVEGFWSISTCKLGKAVGSKLESLDRKWKTCKGSKPYSYARRDNVDGNSQLLDDSDFYQQLLKEFFETIDPMSSGANSIGYLVLFVTASAFLLDLLCGSTEQLTLEI